MRYVSVTVPAKINLALRVGGVRDNGYHALDTIYEAVDVRDVVEAWAADELSLEMSGLGADLPTDETNLAMKAALLMKREFGAKKGDPACGLGARMKVTKKIPLAGGMAGGSADAAGALVALNALWEIGAPLSQLEKLAAELGSDVPFAVRGFVAHGTGRGEKISPVRAGTKHTWVILSQNEGLPTPAVFRHFDVLNPDAADPASTEELRRALNSSQPQDFARLLINDLEAPARALRPDVAALLDDLKHAGYAVLLSGSGPTVLILSDMDAAPELAEGLRHDFPNYTITVARGPVRGAHVTHAE
ncbi:4-diphosphocytidyl-2-C-methyl-D-erythritol kinase [Arcanobacterium wilhelmae]|uniref:4-diphosphocytidyl-2-C-methyl-D-erythritol kinase n=1 Tax=Arcanobacterium wilhelmae TaxID=1803177 RepID=A0ABT9NBW0_9ACTO|nr:4-(cytidine 5'-diphospho)-2-C-methyl-D-erythritol kinase [Arcanobacterium wilhelmae]MDP9801209.1 4-diphosphocytidyl-2-C-methyl-D-erythritol kinase [Arcanobacterium wilhelmae]WFN90559.1 4-(cytidine 5'-diphospho)-2-C-methyl-D-erythritol kinase [Arcanobacterium wilhelmae]